MQKQRKLALQPLFIPIDLTALSIECRETPLLPESEPIQIIQHLFLGSQNHAKNAELRRSIPYALNVAREVSPTEQQQGSSPKTKKFAWGHDSEILDEIEEAVGFIHECLSRSRNVLVHCQLGVSRSATVIIAYFMRYHDMGLREAYNLVKSKAEEISPNVYLMSQLVEYEDMLNQRRR